MTITDAIVKVLMENSKGLTAKQIYEKIVEKKYYNFGAKNPVGVVSIQLNRFCDGQQISNPAIDRCFVVEQVGKNKIYRLKHCRGEIMGENKIFKHIKTIISGIEIYTFSMTVSDLANISYVAVRGKDDEEGAVQRVLNKQRIASIKRYVLDGNMFVNTFVLNWTNTKDMPIVSENSITLPLVYSSAQLIDGQHRLAGLKAAMEENKEIANNYVLVSLALNLETQAAAKIFLNINSEQKPVPKSLIYDLYGITAEERNYAINRANDIANELNDDINSPYYRVIKLPGNPRGKGKLDLSTVVNALKLYVDKDGKFEKKNIHDFNYQYAILCNYFNAIKYHADKMQKWGVLSENIFFKAAGFIGAIDFFFEYVLEKCVALRSFKQEVIIKMFDFSEVDLITPKDIVTTDGRTARKKVVENLREAFISDLPGESDYDF